MEKQKQDQSKVKQVFYKSPLLDLYKDIWNQDLQNKDYSILNVLIH